MYLWLLLWTLALYINNVSGLHFIKTQVEYTSFLILLTFTISKWNIFSRSEDTAQKNGYFFQFWNLKMTSNSNHYSWAWFFYFFCSSYDYFHTKLQVFSPQSKYLPDSYLEIIFALRIFSRNSESDTCQKIYH